jgi:hypothetical protein
MKKKPAMKTLRSSACCSECGGAYEKWRSFETISTEQDVKNGKLTTRKIHMERRSCIECGKTQLRTVEEISAKKELPL